MQIVVNKVESSQGAKRQEGSKGGFYYLFLTFK